MNTDPTFGVHLWSFSGLSIPLFSGDKRDPNTLVHYGDLGCNAGPEKCEDVSGSGESKEEKEGRRISGKLCLTPLALP